MKCAFRSLCIGVGIFLATNSWAGLRGLDGTPHQLSDYTGKGKWTVVMFWASDCGVCNAEIGRYIRFDQAHRNKDARIVGISLDGQANLAAARDFVKRHHVPFPNLVGEPEDVVQLYQSLTGQEWVGTPSFLLYDPHGKLLAAQAGAIPPVLIEKFILENRAKSEATPH